MALWQFCLMAELTLACFQGKVILPLAMYARALCLKYLTVNSLQRHEGCCGECLRSVGYGEICLGAALPVTLIARQQQQAAMIVGLTEHVHHSRFLLEE